VYIINQEPSGRASIQRKFMSDGFDQDEIDSILDKNADGAEWGSPQAFTEEGTKYTLSFATKRGERVERAEYDQTGDNAGILTIQTKAEYYFGKQLKNIDGV
jgi:hypothetical protein